MPLLYPNSTRRVELGLTLGLVGPARVGFGHRLERELEAFFISSLGKTARIVQQ